MKNLLLVLACAALLPSVLLAQVQAEFYVDTNGNDSFEGTPRRPFASLGRARDAVRVAKTPAMTGDIIVYIAAGEYRVASTITFDDQDSGTNGFSVIYRNWNALGSAQLIGGQDLTGWQLHSGNVYKVNVGSEVFHTLFENGRRSRKARSPNLNPDPSFPMSKASYLLTDGANGSHRLLEYKVGDLDPTGWNINDAQVYIWSGGKWDWFSDVIPISSISTSARQITLTQDSRYKIYQNSHGSRYFVQGVLDLLDEPGEYHLDTSTGWLYYWPMELPIGSQSIVMPLVERIIEVKGSSESLRASNIRFEGLSFGVSDFTEWYRWAHVSDGDSGQGHLYPQYDRQMELAQNRTGMFFLGNADNITIKFCHFKNSGFSAIYLEFYNQFHAIYGNWIEHIGHSGIYLAGKYPGEGDVSRDNVISNNKIHNIGEEIGHPAGVYMVNSGHNEISYSQIYNTPRYAVSMPTYVNLPPSVVYGFGNVAKYLDIYAGVQDSGDTAPIYAWGISGSSPFLSNAYEQVLIDRSWAHPSVTDIGPNGIFMDNQTYGQIFTDVKITNAHGALFRNNQSGSHVLSNVNWSGSFNDLLMDYQNIGLKADFPAQYGGPQDIRSANHTPFFPPGVPFYDGFESGFGAWMRGKGSPSASSAVVFSGTQSFVTDQDEDVIYKNLGANHNTRVQSWFYDDGAPIKAVMMRVDAGAWSDGGNWVGLGVSSSASGPNYVKRIGGTFIATTVARSVGWHRFEWDYTSGTDVQLKIDGVQVGSTTNTTFFNQISLGDWWAGAGSGGNYFDEIKMF